MTSQQKSLHSTFSSKDRFERVLPSCDDVDTYTEKRVKAASSAYYKAIDLQKAAQQDFKSLEKEVLSFGSRDPSSDEGIRLQFRVFTGLQKKLEASKRSERREARCQQVGIDRNDYLLHQEDVSVF
jgi:hypothetical protein